MAPEALTGDTEAVGECDGVGVREADTFAGGGPWAHPKGKRTPNVPVFKQAPLRGTDQIWLEFPVHTGDEKTLTFAVPGKDELHWVRSRPYVPFGEGTERQ